MSDVRDIMAAVAERLAFAFAEIEGEHDAPRVEILRSADHAEGILADPPSVLVCYSGRKFDKNIPHSAARQPPTLELELWFSGRDPQDVGQRELDIYTLCDTAVFALLAFKPVAHLVGRMVAMDEDTAGVLPSAIWIRQSWNVRLSTPLRGQT